MDIQSIAVQIAKMRFFISLIVDQKVARASPPAGSSGVPPPGETPGETPGKLAAETATLQSNRGVRPLPNLETKFVAANTLLGVARWQGTKGEMSETSNMFGRMVFKVVARK